MSRNNSQYLFHVLIEVQYSICLCVGILILKSDLKSSINNSCIQDSLASHLVYSKGGAVQEKQRDRDFQTNLLIEGLVGETQATS